MNVITEIKKGQVGTGLLIENDGYVSLNTEANKPIMEAINTGDVSSRRMLPNPFIVSAVFQKFGIENANGRVYPENVLKREVQKYQVAINERRAYGELNHPESSAIDLGRIALNIIELHWEGHTLVGQMEIPISDGFRESGIVSTCADMLAQWLISGLKVGVSSRGLGSVTQQGGRLVVGEDYEIVAWDAVAQPSTPQAWIEDSPEKLRPYIESEKKEGTLIKEDKYSQFDEWLRLND